MDIQTHEVAAPRVKVVGNKVEPEDGNAQFVAAAMQALGTNDRELAVVLVNFLVGAQGKIKQGREPYINAALSAVSQLHPQDIAEALLISQMVAVHANAMSLLAEAVNEDFPPLKERQFSLFLKLARVFVAQFDALRKYRKTEQTTNIGNLNISGDGKAIVGNFGNSPERS